ncbi:2-oxoacid:ferredoxin oxidoreductase subunit beta [Perlabentimonas gracilis]|uniref:2-oxoacid:ferredoxin oxidoreductase subunit beta n=1 Tax=Perlabentimonas gracilis TaxID=2715279 RepID=UPI00140C6AD3|nr:2-oxoacid:ferredoxin oxidoreductase subunit beta [Perlabentimonas gracilis]NHB69972.1 2-oxoacid:ferredoxin oxidoreductase subunit beta [Perlabentimonas gracilis]
MSKHNYTPQDFKSDQEVRWCPGCGDHAILNSVYRALPEVSDALDYSKERYVFVSGIGCSSRFPYYVDTYGFHGIHGRASAIATGMKVANPKLSIWQMTGDGDALAIGGNHFIHAIRRNIDLNIILFNNEIYGLTKGQYSPTSKLGAITKTSPFGTVEQPFRPGELVIGAQGKFFARSIDADVKLTAEILVEAAKHDGTSVVVIQQNCVIYNDKTHADITEREHRADRTIVLKHGQKMIFGKNNEKGLVMINNQLKVVTIGEEGYTMDDILVHNAENPNPGLHVMLANMAYPEFPLALGVIRAVKCPTYDDNVRDQLIEVQKTAKIKCVDDLLHSGDTYEV